MNVEPSGHDLVQIPGLGTPMRYELAKAMGYDWRSPAADPDWLAHRIVRYSAFNLARLVEMQRDGWFVQINLYGEEASVYCHKLDGEPIRPKYYVGRGATLNEAIDSLRADPS